MSANRQLSVFEELRRRQPELSEQAAIRRLCEQLLADAEAEPPIPVERIASLRGVVQIEERNQPWAGTLEPRDGNFVVTVRASDGYERQRFTVCHESGHTLFPGYTDRQLRCNGARTRLEQWCDTAASELLLPYRFFVADLAAAAFSLETVEQLAGDYEASLEATALRTVSLWSEPSLLLVFRQQHKPSERGREQDCEPKVRLRYAAHNGGWSYLRRHKSVADDSPFARAFAGEIVHEIGSLGDLTSDDVGQVEIQARCYGRDRRVLALIRRQPRRPPQPREEAQWRKPRRRSANGSDAFARTAA